MKKIVLFLLVLCMIVVFPSCTESDFDNSKVTIYLNSGNSLIPIINDYNKKNNYIIDLKLFDDPKELNTKCASELMAGQGPDLFYLGSAEKALRQQKPQYIKYPLSFIHKIWYNTHIADAPKTGAFYQKTANLRGVEVCTSTKTVHK